MVWDPCLIELWDTGDCKPEGLTGEVIILLFATYGFSTMFCFETGDLTGDSLVIWDGWYLYTSWFDYNLVSIPIFLSIVFDDA